MLPPDPDNLAYRLEWWVEGKLVGEQLSKETADGFVYICEHAECGPWAMKYFPNRALIRMHGACARHAAERGEIPGSLVLWWTDELERMPDVLVERELEIHLAYYERMQNVQEPSGDTRRSETANTPRPDRQDLGGGPFSGGSGTEGQDLERASTG